MAAGSGDRHGESEQRRAGRSVEGYRVRPRKWSRVMIEAAAKMQNHLQDPILGLARNSHHFWKKEKMSAATAEIAGCFC